MEHIYVLKCQDAIKIGYSSDVDKRIRAHKTSNPFIEFVAKYEAPKWAEKFIHKKLSSHLKSGCTEWFNYFDGIYALIDDLINEVKVENDKRLEKAKHRQSFLAKKEEEPIKVFKFRDSIRPDYAYVAAKNLARALKIIAYVSPIKPVLIEENDALHYGNLIKGTEYILKSDLRTKAELDFCKKNLIDFHKEYGKTFSRIRKLTTNDSFIVSESLWNKPMNKVYDKKFKNSKPGRRKRKFIKNHN